MSSVQKSFYPLLKRLTTIPNPPSFPYDLTSPPQKNNINYLETSPLPTPLQSPSRQDIHAEEDVEKIMDSDYDPPFFPYVPIPYKSSNPYEKNPDNMEIVLPKIEYLSILSKNPK